MIIADSLMPPMPEPPRTAGEVDAAFDAALAWLADNHGLLADGQRRGPGLVVPLRTRTETDTGIPAFKTLLLPYRKIAMIDGTLKKITPLDAWLTMPQRFRIAGFRTAPGKPWPTFVEDGKRYVNLYRRPDLPEDGDASLGHDLLAKLLPEPEELNWFPRVLAHKLRHPEIPGPSTVMIAHDLQGTGRGALFKIMEGIFGCEYIARPDFDDVIGTSGQALFNEWMASSIWALVNETSADEDHRYVIKKKAYERIKELVDTSRQRRAIKGKYEKRYVAECGPGFIFASNNASPLPTADKDRRLSFLRNGPTQPAEYYAALDRWRSVPGNLGAFRRDLERIDLTGFNAYAPLHTRLKDVVTEDSCSALDAAVADALEMLPGEIVLSVQVVETIVSLRNRGGIYLRGEWETLAMREVKNKLRRIGLRDGLNWKPSLPDRGRMAAYARTEEARAKWTAASHELVLAELQKNEAALAKWRAKGFAAFASIMGGATEAPPVERGPYAASEDQAKGAEAPRPDNGDAPEPRPRRRVRLATVVSDVERQERQCGRRDGEKTDEV
jgi:Family of unknown function (DUF5906)